MAETKPITTTSVGGISPRDFVTRFQAGVWRYLRVLGCDTSQADDLTQDAFLAVLQREDFVHYSDAATRAYLRRVALNLFISSRRKSGRMVVTDELEPLDREWEKWSPHDNGEEALEALRECFEQLTERAQLALTMRFRDKGSRSSISEALGISEHGAKNLMQRAKDKLRRCVQGKIE